MQDDDVRADVPLHPRRPHGPTMTAVPGRREGGSLVFARGMRMTVDREVDAWYLQIVNVIAAGQAVEQVVVGRPGRGEIVLDFDPDGFLLGVEVLGASRLLTAGVLDASEDLVDKPSPAGDGT